MKYTCTPLSTNERFYGSLDHRIMFIWIVVADPGLEQVAENVQRIRICGIILQKCQELLADVRTPGVEVQIRNEKNSQRQRSRYSNS